MKLKKLKTEAEVLAALGGKFDWPVNHVEVSMVDGAIKGVRIGKIHINAENYGFQVMQEVDHEIEDRYRIIAKAPGFPDQVDYCPTYDAARAKQKSYDTAADVSEIETVRCLVNSKGEVIAEAGPADKPVDHNGMDVPF